MMAISAADITRLYQVTAYYFLVAEGKEEVDR